MWKPGKYLQNNQPINNNNKAKFKYFLQQDGNSRSNQKSKLVVKQAGHIEYSQVFKLWAELLTPPHEVKQKKYSNHVEWTAWENQSFQLPFTHRCFASLILFFTSASRRMVIAEFWAWRNVTCQEVFHSEIHEINSLLQFFPLQKDLRKNSPAVEDNN